MECALIIQSIDPLGRIIAFNFLQEFNLGPNARLISIDREPDFAGCSGLQLCVSRCPQGNGTSNCVAVCKEENSRSTEPCSEECINEIRDDGEMDQFLKKCVHTMLTEPPKMPTGSSGNSG